MTTTTKTKRISFSNFFVLLAFCFSFCIYDLLFVLSPVGATSACTFNWYSSSGDEWELVEQNNYTVGALYISPDYGTFPLTHPPTELTQNGLSYDSSYSSAIQYDNIPTDTLVSGTYVWDITSTSGSSTTYMNGESNQIYTYSDWITSGGGYYNDAAVCTHNASLVPPTTAPAAPVLSGTAGVNQDVLNWTAPTGAVTYDLYRGSTDVDAGTSSTTYTDTSVTAGTNYTYYITATGTGGTSVDSNSVTLNPEPDSQITTRDINIFGFGLALSVGFFTIKQFRFRGR